MNKSTRRSFLQATSALGAAALLPVRPLWAQPASPSGGNADRVKLAAVGTAQRGLKNLEAFAKSGLADVVALCDVQLNQKDARKAAQDHPEAKSFTDFRVMFDAMADDIDAVAISTADHSHFAVAMHAMMLGKHVYVEKPLAHTFGQTVRLMEMAESTGLVTQMGNQGHTSPNFTQFEAWTQAGLFREVDQLTAYMNLPRRWHAWGAGVNTYEEAPMPEGLDWEAWAADAPKPPFSRRLHPGNWRGWYSHGCGTFGDWGPHLLDTAHRFLKLGLPHTVTAVKREGLSDLVYPQLSTIRFSFAAREGLPPCELTWHDGAGNLPQLDPALGSTNAETGAWERFEIDPRRPGRVLHAGDHVFQGGSHGRTLSLLTREGAGGLTEADLPEYKRPRFNHQHNFLLACLGRAEAQSPFSVSGPLNQVFNLGMLAQQFGGKLEFDAASGQITNHAEANALLDPAPRSGWERYHQL